VTACTRMVDQEVDAPRLNFFVWKTKAGKRNSHFNLVATVCSPPCRGINEVVAAVVVVTIPS